MFGSAAAVLWAGSVAWALTRAVGQYRAYRNIEPQPLPRQPPRVAVVVPARNERDTIRDCVAGLTSQHYPADRLAIYIVDDNSSDGTAAIVRDLARRLPIQPIAAGPRPRGWAGKPWACRVGAAAAAGGAEWLCFIDADVTPRPALIASAVATAERCGLDMLSLAPAQRISGVTQAMVMPVAFLLLALSQDLRRVNDPASPQAAANGQFLLIRRVVYDRLGGHAAVAGAIADDKALACRVKRAGFRLALLGGERLCECRMYRSFAGWWHGLARNVSHVLDHSGKALAAAGIATAAAFAAPLVPWWLSRLAAAGSVWDQAAFGLALAASAALLVTHIRAARYFAVSPIYGACFPIGYLLGAAILVHSVYRRRSGRLDWKGRTYVGAMVAGPGAAVYSGVDGPHRTGD